MTQRHPKQPQEREDDAETEQLSPLEETLDAQMHARMVALEEENERLRAELHAHRQVEATLRQREEQFRTLVNNVPGAVYRAAFNDD